jgi:hypothetical protein
LNTGENFHLTQQQPSPSAEKKNGRNWLRWLAILTLAALACWVGHHIYRVARNACTWKEELLIWESWSAFLAGIAFSVLLFWACCFLQRRGGWWRIGVVHFATVVGLPCAGIAALCLVVVLQTVAGDVEFKIGWFEFHGAAGPIVMWVLCFVAISSAIRFTWNLEHRPTHTPSKN